MKKHLFASLLLLFTGSTAWAQLYSSGNNSISGSYVGIRQSSPQASLHIKETPGAPGLGLPGQNTFTYVPLLRFEYSPALGSQTVPGSFNWDFRMDGGSALTLWHQSGTGASAPKLRFTNDLITAFEKLAVGTFAEFGPATAPDASQGHYLSLGIREVGSGGWQGNGGVIFSTSSGQLQFMTNGTGSILSGATQMSNHVAMTMDETEVVVNVPTRIKNTAIIEDDVNIQGVLTGEAASIFKDDVNVQGAFTSESVSLFEDDVIIQGDLNADNDIYTDGRVYAQQGLLSEGEIRSQFHVGIEVNTIGSGGDGEGRLIFYDQDLNGSAFNQLFQIKTFGINHPDAPKTIEITDVGHGGNIYTNLPVRIGGAYDALNVISNDYKLYVAKGIRTERVKVDVSGNWPDYVFEDDYELKSFDELRAYIEAEGHLPNMPAAAQTEAEGIDLGEINTRLLEKVEELTLYILELEERVNSLESVE